MEEEGDTNARPHPRLRGRSRFGTAKARPSPPGPSGGGQGFTSIKHGGIPTQDAYERPGRRLTEAAVWNIAKHAKNR
jgi:hypothetical protein